MTINSSNDNNEEKTPENENESESGDHSADDNDKDDDRDQELPQNQNETPSRSNTYESKVPYSTASYGNGDPSSLHSSGFVPSSVPVSDFHYTNLFKHHSTRSEF